MKEIVIGLEVHLELHTASKAFCRCSTAFGAPPNSQVCPVCLGLPGALPVVNERIIEYGIRAGLALNCDIASWTRFDRKNYFYPDLPKGYQISQYQYPLATGGWLSIPVTDGWKRIGITRVHMEEDTGKLMHVADGSLVDFNRCGVPLLEIVSEPDLSSPEEARSYLQELRTTLAFTDISDMKMEQGSLRCDANISLAGEDGSEGVLVEVKNMNSFRAVKLALEYEVQRQSDILSRGESVIRETRHWDEARQVTFSSRSKEEANDYRYFPEPDLLPIVVDGERVLNIKEEMPELPMERRRRLVEEMGLPEYDARVLTASPELSMFFDQTVSGYGDAKVVSNWIMGDFLRCLNALGVDVGCSPVTPDMLVELLTMIDEGRISGKIAKTVLEEMCGQGVTAHQVIRDRGLEQISDRDHLLELVRATIKAHPGPVGDYRAGKKKSLGFLVGQIMKQTQGRANPQLVNELFESELT